MPLKSSSARGVIRLQPWVRRKRPALSQSSIHVSLVVVNEVS